MSDPTDHGKADRRHGRDVPAPDSDIRHGADSSGPGFAAVRYAFQQERSGGRERPSILADMVEAIIAALYLDAGMERAQRFIREQVLQDADLSREHRSADYKTQLQELVQQKSDQHIQYRMTAESGPDHDKRFTFRVSVNGVDVGEGSGRTKKEAEQNAARRALEDWQP